MEKSKRQMTDRERVEALLRHEKPDRVPFWPCFPMGYSSVYAGASIADTYNKPQVALDAHRNACREFGWVFTPMFGYAGFGGWEFGGDIKWPSSEYAQAPTVTHHIETPDDVMNLEMPDVKTSGIVPMMLDYYNMASQERLDNEPFNIKCPCTGVFSIAGNICGQENLCRWLIKAPETVHHLIGLASDYLLELTGLWKDRFGIEGVLPFGSEHTSANLLISPRHFEQFALPYLKEVNEKILDLGFKTIYMHVCGEQNANLIHWEKIPMGDPGIISIDSDVTLETAASHFPNDIILGNLNPTIIQTGTPEEVYEASREIIEKGKELPGGFVFSPGGAIPPMAPSQNVRMMTRAINDFGWYD